MLTAAKITASTETAKDTQTLAAAPDSKSLKARASMYSPHEAAQRRKWGVETGAVRSLHARKF
jgi:hypothetical protein